MLNGTLVFSFETEEHNGNVIGKQNEFTNKVDTDLHAHALVWFNFLCNDLGWIANWNSNGGQWEMTNIKH